ncbi:hypothetical protein TSUD_64980 [Trifolium subterraneum]|uniref:SWIM-type domain-containing protein n=1 Tax=Trifolium subterraneum TaxID=3900 RepID=A0A2Z6P892_TRISU|nr:hypothetical protein TSUD_64980 [Trifolium subterraneum]
MTSSNVDRKPMVGMEFDNIDVAYQFWLAYSVHAGFGVRKRFTNKNKVGAISSYRFVCSKEGKKEIKKSNALASFRRAETRTDCKARISLGCHNGKFVIHEFVEDHNHTLQPPETTHLLASHRKITEVQANEIDLAEDSGLRQKATFQLMRTHAGARANVGFTQMDVKNYINERRRKKMEYGEAACNAQYFQQQLLENPSFFHAHQLDVDEKITNVFWCDANMILDYGYFGDVVSLDTTYCTNNVNRPLALFSGFNHYRGSIIFGAALLYDETTESFKWLFDTFLQANNNKKPRTVFTDQAPAMVRALAEVMPETHHGLCTWHLLQNGIKNIGNLMKGGSYFLTDFKKCMYNIDIEADFETAWNNLINDYNAHDSDWLKSVYAIKKKWASCYMKESLTLGMRSTQISESVNAHFKSCMKPNVDIVQFFKHFEQVIEEKRAKELHHEYESSHKLPRLIYELSPILVQMGKVYTHTVFELFQNEFKLFLALSLSERNESHSLCEYVITMGNHERSWRVSFDRASNSITCSCKNFETFGILCSHALKVIEANDVKIIPEKYILRRWTRDARCGVVQDFRGKEVEGDPKLSRTRKFKEVVSKFIKEVAEASLCEEDLKIVEESVDVMRKKIMELRSQAKENESHNSDNPTFPNCDAMKSKRLKIRPNLKRQSQKRFKSFIELQPRGKQKKSFT